ncbi:MAG: hypothetical protein U0S12_05205 [Fimbriimonadales bacterium]
MSALLDAWKEALPEVRNGVTGRATWNALNVSVPVTIENGVLIMGLDPKDRELSGHLTAPAVKRLIETEMSFRLGQNLTLRVIDGTGPSDWERAKRRDQEADRLRDQAREKLRAELAAKSTWDGVYEQLTRSYAGIQNKTMPQNRARFMEEAVGALAAARADIPERDELAERNFARCIERVAQYTEVPATQIAYLVMQRAGEF